MNSRLTKTVEELSEEVSAATSEGEAADSGQGGGAGKRGMLARIKKG